MRESNIFKIDLWQQKQKIEKEIEERRKEIVRIEIDLWQQKQKIEKEIEERRKELGRINAQLTLPTIQHSKIGDDVNKNDLLISKPNLSSPNNPKPALDWSEYKPLPPTWDINSLTKETIKPTKDLFGDNKPQPTDKIDDGFPTILLWLFALLMGIYIISYQDSREQQKPNNQGYLMNVPALLG
jgi:hypothetical protein